MTYDDLVQAFLFVSGALSYEHSAVVHRVSGEIFYASPDAGIDEIPREAEGSDDYLWIPDQNDLDLGPALVMDYVRTRCDEEIETVLTMFRRKGAYRRFKALLARKGLLEDWYAFEQERTREALLAWCAENGLVLQ
jgi:hypothetical protein